MPAGPTPKPLYFQQGFEDENIAEIQQRLMDLGYMDNDEPTNYYGPNTKEAVEIFQRQHGVTVTGVVDRATYEKLFSDEALTYMADLGISGSDVEDIQSRLRELDYLDKVTGYFGEETEKAVKRFPEEQPPQRGRQGGDPDPRNAIQRGRGAKEPEVRRKER